MTSVFGVDRRDVRVEIAPKGNVDNDRMLEDFTRAVLAVDPSATGGPVAILESAHTIISAFIEPDQLANLVGASHQPR